MEKNSKLRTFSDGMLKSSKLDKIEQLLDHCKNETERAIIFIIPWIVIKELDALKLAKNKTSYAARQATNLLLALSKQKSQFIMFQTSSEVGCCSEAFVYSISLLF